MTRDSRLQSNLVSDIQSPPGNGGRLSIIFLLESLASAGSTLMVLGIFFYTHQRFGWEKKQNFLLAAAEGIAYVVGALSTSPLAGILGRRRLLALLNIALAVVSICGIVFPGEVSIIVILFLYVLLSSAQWPALESLLCADASPSQISRRLMIYNLVWSATSAITVAISGAIITRYAPGIFVVALLCHLAAIASLTHPAMRRSADKPSQATGEHVAPEPELLKRRTLAMQLSRVALPSTYAVVYSMAAMMPTLPVIEQYSPSMQTVVASVWMVARWLSFILLGVTVWWHTRPRALLIATIIMLAAFLTVTIRPSDAFRFWNISSVTDGVSMILGQIFLGCAMGMIYCGSLYFGMVLSEGSTEHGGYHEALIGLGGTLGPGVGAMAAIAFAGSPGAAVIGIAMILSLSVAISGWVSIRAAAKT